MSRSCTSSSQSFFHMVLQLNIKLQATLETCIQSRHVAWQFQQCRYLQCICPIFFRDRKAPSGWQGRCVCFFHTSSSAPLFLHETRQMKKHKELWKISQETLCLSSQAETCQWAEENMSLIVQGLWHQIFERLSCSRHCKNNISWSTNAVRKWVVLVQNVDQTTCW